MEKTTSLNYKKTFNLFDSTSSAHFYKKDPSSRNSKIRASMSTGFFKSGSGTLLTNPNLEMAISNRLSPKAKLDEQGTRLFRIKSKRQRRRRKLAGLSGAVKPKPVDAKTSYKLLPKTERKDISFKKKKNKSEGFGLSLNHWRNQVSENLRKQEEMGLKRLGASDAFPSPKFGSSGLAFTSNHSRFHKKTPSLGLIPRNVKNDVRGLRGAQRKHTRSVMNSKMLNTDNLPPSFLKRNREMKKSKNSLRNINLGQDGEEGRLNVPRGSFNHKFPTHDLVVDELPSENQNSKIRNSLVLKNSESEHPSFENQRNRNFSSKIEILNKTDFSLMKNSPSNKNAPRLSRAARGSVQGSNFSPKNFQNLEIEVDNEINKMEEIGQIKKKASTRKVSLLKNNHLIMSKSLSLILKEGFEDDPPYKRGDKYAVNYLKQDSIVGDGEGEELGIKDFEAGSSSISNIPGKKGSVVHFEEGVTAGAGGNNNSSSGSSSTGVDGTRKLNLNSTIMNKEYFDDLKNVGKTQNKGHMERLQEKLKEKNELVLLEKYLKNDNFRDFELKYFEAVDILAQAKVKSEAKIGKVEARVKDYHRSPQHKIQMLIRSNTIAEFKANEEKMHVARLKKKVEKLLPRFNHTWKLFNKLGPSAHLTYLIKSNQLVRYGSLINKMLYSKDDITLYKWLSPEYMRNVMKFQLIPKIYSETIHPDFIITKEKIQHKLSKTVKTTKNYFSSLQYSFFFFVLFFSSPLTHFHS